MSTTLRDLVVLAYENQDTLNKKLNENWAAQGWNYARAIWTEAGEATQHIKSWFWWKEGEFNKPMSERTLNDVRMELVDILHFGLSLNLVSAHMIYKNTVEEHHGELAAMMVEEFTRAKIRMDSWYVADQEDSPAPATNELLVKFLEDVVASAIQTTWFNQKAFFGACLMAGMDLEHLLTLYFAKSTLNNFRWQNGYNDKTYIKMWPDPSDNSKKVEDNVVLQQIVSTWVENGGSLLKDGVGSFDNEIALRLYYHYHSFVLPGPKIGDSLPHVQV